MQQAVAGDSGARGGSGEVGEITELLRQASQGNSEASNRLFSLMYDELKQLAHASLRRAGAASELNTTTIVHESFLRFARQGGYTPQDRRAFYCYVGKVMRSVVLDAVREQQAQKRGGDQVFVTLTTGVGDEPVDVQQLSVIDTALDALGGLAPDLKELVELRYFAGLTVEQVSELLGRSPRSVQRDWEKGRLLLRRLIEES